MNTLSERVDVLENAAARREEELRELESVSTERQDALLSVIASLEDRIVVLQDKLKIQSERTDTRPEQPVTPWRDCANAVNVVLSQPTTLEDGGLCVAVEAPAPSGSSSHSPCTEVVSPLAQAASPAPTTKDAMLVGARTSPDSRGKTADCHLGGKTCSRPAKGPQHDDHCADGARDCCESGKSPSDGSISFFGRMPTLFGPKRVAGAPEQVMVCLEADGLLVPRNGTVKSVVCLVRSARTARPVTCEA